MYVKLSDIVDIRTGYSFRGRIDDDPTGKLAVIQIKDVREGSGIDLSDCIHIHEVPAHGRHLLKPGDVVMQARGSQFPAAVVNTPEPCLASFGLHVLRPMSKDKVLPDYLAWVLNQPPSRAALENLARGSAIPFVSKTDLGLLPVPIPPRTVQQRIVDAARLQHEAARLSTELGTLQNQYAAAITWRAANNDGEPP